MVVTMQHFNIVSVSIVLTNSMDSTQKKTTHLDFKLFLIITSSTYLHQLNYQQSSRLLNDLTLTLKSIRHKLSRILNETQLKNYKFLS